MRLFNNTTLILIKEVKVQYQRQIPNRCHQNIVTKKAKFFGQLMYCILVAGGYPGCFRYDMLRKRTIESVLDPLLPNNINFKITYKKEE